MKNLLTICLIAAVACVFCVPALGQKQREGKGGRPGPNPAMVFRQADADKDVNVTFEEVTAAFPEMKREAFDRMDRDKDGVVNAKEIVQGPGAQFQQLITRADADKDGKLTLEEAQATMPKMTGERFSKMDKDGDGFLTAKDAPARPQAGASNRPDRSFGPFNRGDTDGDGKVSREEFMATPNASEDLFKRLDRNGDGFVSADDMRRPDMGLPPRMQTLDPAQLDKNGDGKLSYEEATAFFPPLLREAFDRLDLNKDGFVSMDEVARQEVAQPDA